MAQPLEHRQSDSGGREGAITPCVSPVAPPSYGVDVSVGLRLVTRKEALTNDRGVYRSISARRNIVPDDRQGKMGHEPALQRTELSVD